MSVAIIVFSVIVIILVCSYFSPGEQRTRAKFHHLLEERPKRPHEDYWQAYFPGSLVTPEMVSKIRNLFDDQFGMDLRGLGPDDDLSKEYSMIWEMDSLADVEILVGLEKEFGIQITHAEAASLKSVRMIAELVAAKLAQPRMEDADDIG
jgi:acyl carrier protein